MSLKAMTWAFAQDLKPNDKIVLLALADHSDDDGVCWPSMENIADKASMTRRGVQKIIARLEANGLVKKTPRDRYQTNVFTLNMGGANDVQGRTVVHGGCEQPFTGGANSGSHKPSINHQLTTNILVKDEFDEFWKQYPRKVAKGNARKAFTKARKTTSFEAIMASVHRYAAERAGDDPQFTKHPATWLNQECWNDEPAPPRAPPQREKSYGEIIQELKEQHDRQANPNFERDRTDTGSLRIASGG